jgi:hypothetical protein
MAAGPSRKGAERDEWPTIVAPVFGKNGVVESAAVIAEESGRLFI